MDSGSIKKIRKRANIATKIRNEGNDLYVSKNHDGSRHLEILRLYCKSIAYAPKDSEELAISYSNRSMLMLHFKKYDKCLLDIHRALQITSSNKLKVKLLIRKAECIQAGDLDWEEDLEVDDRESAVEVILGQAEYLTNEISDKKDLESKKSLKKLLTRTRNGLKDIKTHKIGKSEKKIFAHLESVGEIPCASDAINLNFDEPYDSKCLTVNRDVRTGETLIVEEFIGYPSNVNLYVTCSHCLTVAESCIPCNYCVFAVYCSEKCKKLAWEKYHDKECSDVDYYSMLKFDDSVKSMELVQIVMLARRLLICGTKESKENPIRYLNSQFEEYIKNRGDLNCK